MSTPIIIAIAGPTCSGKTLIANSLANNLSDATVISMDSYYRDLTTVPSEELEHWNFDQPSSIDYRLMIEHIQSLSGGNSIVKPVYQFPSHTRAAEGVEIIPGRYIMLDGLFALYWKDLIKHYQLSVFIQASDEVCLKRRLARDPVERGFTPEYISRQYRDTVRPMYNKFIHPTRLRADLLVKGEDNPLVNVEKILSLL